MLRIFLDDMALLFLYIVVILLFMELTSQCRTHKESYPCQKDMVMSPSEEH